MTSQSFSGALGGIEGADEKCRQAAQRAGLVRAYKAIISDDSTPVKQRLVLVGAVYTFGQDDTKIKILDLGGDLLKGVQLLDPINRDESGSVVSADVWTGSDSDGGSDGLGNCSNWSQGTSSFQGSYGDPELETNYWIENPVEVTCDNQLRLYCISQ